MPHCEGASASPPMLAVGELDGFDRPQGCLDRVAGRGAFVVMVGRPSKFLFDVPPFRGGQWGRGPIMTGGDHHPISEPLL